MQESVIKIQYQFFLNSTLNRNINALCYNQVAREKAGEEQRYYFTSLSFTRHSIITLVLSLTLKNSLFMSLLYFIIIQKVIKSYLQCKIHNWFLEESQSLVVLPACLLYSVVVLAVKCTIEENAAFVNKKAGLPTSSIRAYYHLELEFCDSAV